MKCGQFTVFRVSPRVVIREIDDEFVAVHTGQGKIYRLNWTAGKILKTIKESSGLSLKEISDFMTETYSGEQRNNVISQVRAFLQEAIQYGLVEVSDVTPDK